MTDTPDARQPTAPLWTDERIDELIISVLFNNHTPRGLARRVSYTVRDDYETALAAANERIRHLEAELADEIVEVIGMLKLYGYEGYAEDMTRYRELTGREYGEDNTDGK